MMVMVSPGSNGGMSLSVLTRTLYSHSRLLVASDGHDVTTRFASEPAELTNPPPPYATCGAVHVAVSEMI